MLRKHCQRTRGVFYVDHGLEWLPPARVMAADGLHPSFEGFPRNLPLPLIRRLYGEDYQITQLGVTFIERSYVKNKIIRETLWHLKKGSTC
ncbi:hypothetical protein V5799_027464 [Amblyomma americanum]|uniref:Uncharacterized protein n=1 Tax=Amblyomma americanum TaxID=6943 RepID=A0AAQ4DFM4_AMBAM